MYISTPLRQLPPTNDSERNNIRSWMKSGAELFDRPDMLFIATNGEEGREPEKTSVQFDWGGQSAMRSGWDDQALYLFFDAGPAGVSHQHEDKLHIDISAFGRDFLTDGGKGSYIPDKWRDYFVSTRAHNTIMIDGQGQRRIPDPTTHRTNSALHRQWLSNQFMDFASGSYLDGYGQAFIAVRHSRYVIFKKNEYWLVLDVLAGEGTHKFESLFHFTPGDVFVENEQKLIRTRFSDGNNIQLIANATKPVAIDIIKGQENPEQGWIYENGERKAIPVAVISGEDQLPLQMITLIEPVRENNFSVSAVKIAEKTEKQCRILVKRQDGDDTWLINLNKENRLNDAGVIEEACISFSRSQHNQIMEQQTFKFEE
jgi:hypothetical protein